MDDGFRNNERPSLLSSACRQLTGRRNITRGLGLRYSTKPSCYCTCGEKVSSTCCRPDENFHKENCYSGCNLLWRIYLIVDVAGEDSTHKRVVGGVSIGLVAALIDICLTTRSFQEFSTDIFKHRRCYVDDIMTK